MKITKKCPECGGTEIYTTESQAVAYSAAILPGIGVLFGGSNLEIYVCSNCGYHQFFVHPEALKTVKKKWKRHS